MRAVLQRAVYRYREIDHVELDVDYLAYEQLPDTLWRIVKTDPPTVKDFQSRTERGLPPIDPDQPELNDGISAFDSEARAKQQATEVPRLGRFVAEFWIPDDCEARRTGQSPGHYTVWGEAETLLASVARVVPVK